MERALALDWVYMDPKNSLFRFKDPANEELVKQAQICIPGCGPDCFQYPSGDHMFSRGFNGDKPLEGGV